MFDNISVRVIFSSSAYHYSARLAYKRFHEPLQPADKFACAEGVGIDELPGVGGSGVAETTLSSI